MATPPPKRQVKVGAFLFLFIGQLEMLLQIVFWWDGETSGELKQGIGRPRRIGGGGMMKQRNLQEKLPWI